MEAGCTPIFATVTDEVSEEELHTEACHVLDEGHFHNEACYWLDEGYSHGDWCYVWNAAGEEWLLYCGEEERTAEWFLVCGTEEKQAEWIRLCYYLDEGHLHIEECYIWDEDEEGWHLICQTEERGAQWIPTCNSFDLQDETEEVHDTEAEPIGWHCYYETTPSCGHIDCFNCDMEPDTGAGSPEENEGDGPSILFEYGNPMELYTGELYEGMDTDWLLLLGVTATDENGVDITDLLYVYDDDGFAEFVDGYITILNEMMAPSGESHNWFEDDRDWFSEYGEDDNEDDHEMDHIAAYGMDGFGFKLGDTVFTGKIIYAVTAVVSDDMEETEEAASQPRDETEEAASQPKEIILGRTREVIVQYGGYGELASMACNVMDCIHSWPASGTSGLGASNAANSANPHIVGCRTGLDRVRRRLDNHYKIVRNIDLEFTYAGVALLGSSINWDPIGTNNSGNAFSGTLAGEKGVDGKPLYTISNLQISGIGGLFRSLRAATVSDINIVLSESGKVSSSAYSGTLSGRAHAVNNVPTRIENVHISGHPDPDVRSVVGAASASNTTSYHGGMVGFLEGSHIKGCSVRKVRLQGGDRIGGIAGLASAGSIIEDCLVEDMISRTHGTNNYHGGIAGLLSSSEILGSSVKSASLEGNAYVGGAAGAAFTGASIRNTTVENVMVHGRSSYTGGFLGVLYNACKEPNTSSSSPPSCNCREPDGVRNAHVTGAHVINAYVTNESRYAGGFVGAVYCTSFIDGSTVKGVTVFTESHYAGGYVGALYGRGRIDNSHVTDARVMCGTNRNGSPRNVSTSYNAGGFASLLYNNSEINKSSVTNAEVLVRRSYAAGFAGNIYNRARVTDSHVTNVHITALNYAGGFAGSIYNSARSVGNSVTGADVHAMGYRAGGFAANLYNSAYVSGCTVNGFMADRQPGKPGPLPENVPGDNLPFIPDLHGSLAGGVKPTHVRTSSTSTSSTQRKYSGTGGFAGVAYNSAIMKRCLVTNVIVESILDAGGFIGYAYNSANISISRVEQADVRGGENAGGFIGSSMSFTDTASSSNASLHNTYVQGTVSGHTNVGGFVGLHQNGSRGSIFNSYTATTITVISPPEGGAPSNIGAFSGLQATGNREGRFTGTNYFDSTLATSSGVTRPIGSVDGIPANALPPLLQGRPSEIMASEPVGSYEEGDFRRPLSDPDFVYSGWAFGPIWEEPPREPDGYVYAFFGIGDGCIDDFDGYYPDWVRLNAAVSGEYDIDDPDHTPSSERGIVTEVRIHPHGSLNGVDQKNGSIYHLVIQDPTRIIGANITKTHSIDFDGRTIFVEDGRNVTIRAGGTAVSGSSSTPSETNRITLENNADRHFWIEERGTLTVGSGITIDGGSAPGEIVYGSGGIMVDGGRLFLHGLTAAAPASIENCNDEMGGAIYVAPCGILTRNAASRIGAQRGPVANI